MPVITPVIAKAVLFFIVLATSSQLLSAPVSEEQRTPIDLRRTTLVVSDIEHSLEFYRDALGMQVTYDNHITTPRNTDITQAERASRLTLLRANDNFIGMLGLLQYIKPEKPAVDLSESAFLPGTTVLVFNSDEQSDQFAKASQVEGVKVLSQPSLTSYPSYSGEGSISVMVSVLQDPDGFIVELNQLQEALH